MNPCRNCSAPNTANTNVYDEGGVRPGDVSICLECGCVSMFDDDGEAVEPTKEWWDEMPEDSLERVLATVDAWKSTQ